jgi:hypothetical protein
MTRSEHIHRLFNELHRELWNEVAERHTAELGEIDPERIAKQVDALHHDFTNLTLEEIA